MKVKLNSRIPDHCQKSNRPYLLPKPNPSKNFAKSIHNLVDKPTNRSKNNFPVLDVMKHTSCDVYWNTNYGLSSNWCMVTAKSVSCSHLNVTRHDVWRITRQRDDLTAHTLTFQIYNTTTTFRSCLRGTFSRLCCIPINLCGNLWGFRCGIFWVGCSCHQPTASKHWRQTNNCI